MRAPRLGGIAFRTLIERVASARGVFELKPGALRALGLRAATVDYIRHPDWARIDADQRWLEKDEHHLVRIVDDEVYPALLREIPDPPPALFVRGSVATLSARQLAVVGSRNPSPAGRNNAHDFAGSLVRAGFAVISGLALGIDAAAHRGALAGGGVTLAVAGTGLDTVYPSAHHGLLAEILERGAYISEFPPATPPLPGHFPRRNRIISGLSLGTLVVEAAPRSGSLITARSAVEQGREVFAIPGSIHNPLARGCHGLIHEGAKLVESVRDILEELGPIGALHSQNSKAEVSKDGRELSNDERNLLKYIAYEARSVDTLVAETGQAPEFIAALLLALELQGYVSASVDGRYHRVR